MTMTKIYRVTAKTGPGLAITGPTPGPKQAPGPTLPPGGKSVGPGDSVGSGDSVRPGLGPVFAVTQILKGAFLQHTILLCFSVGGVLNPVIQACFFTNE